MTRSGILAAALLLAAAPVATAEAGLLKIRPSAFRAQEGDSEYDRHPGAVGVSSKGSTFARFTAPFRLPAGSRITAIRFFYTGAAPGDVYVSAGYLDPQDPAGDLVSIGAAVSAAATGENSPVLEPLAVSSDSAEMTVLRRRRYVLNATAQPSGYLWEVRVSYDGPELAEPPAAEAAGQRVVKPLELQPLSNRQIDLRDPFSVRSGGDYDSEFWAPVRLPLGAVIRGVRYQHASDGGFTTRVALVRARPDAAEALEVVADALSLEDTGSNLEFVTVTGPPATGAKRKVQAAWRYAVWVVSPTPNAAIGQITVLY